MAVILLDALANVLCLAMAQRIAGKRVHAPRTAAAALIGALAAHGARMAGISRSGAALCWLPLAVCMTAVAVKRVSLRMALLLTACEGFLGGTVYALSGALGSLHAAWCVGAGFALMMAVSAQRARHAAHDVCTVRIRITAGASTAEFSAMVDSGNCLRDYLTHLPVIVLPEAAKRRLGLEGVPMRPLFADTAGGRQMMDCLTLRRALVIGQGKAVQVRACAAFSPGLSGDAPALLPQALMTAYMKEAGHRAGYSADQEGKIYGNAEE